jgi:hypothetical protein
MAMALKLIAPERISSSESRDWRTWSHSFGSICDPMYNTSFARNSCRGYLSSRSVASICDVSR